MKNIILATLVCVGLIGCGGGTTTASDGTSGNNTQTTSTVTSDFKIDLTKVSGYSSNDSVEDQYLSVINYLRSLHIKCNDETGVSGPSGVDLQWNIHLEDAAQEHSNDMANSHFFAHAGSGTSNDITGQTFTPSRQSSPADRVARQGYDYSITGENIFVKYTHPNEADNIVWVEAMEGWMTSTTGHCSNIMNHDYRDFAMAEVRGEENRIFSDGVTRLAKTSYWTQSFAAK